MDTITAVLGNELVVQALLGLVVVVWVTIKGSEWYQKNVVDTRYNRLLEAVEVAVTKTYKDYVRPLKESKPGEKMTREEAENAMKMALHEVATYLFEYYKVKDIGVPTEYVESLIEETVREFKS